MNGSKEIRERTENLIKLFNKNHIEVLLGSIGEVTNCNSLENCEIRPKVVISMKRKKDLNKLLFQHTEAVVCWIFNKLNLAEALEKSKCKKRKCLLL